MVNHVTRSAIRVGEVPGSNPGAPIFAFSCLAQKPPFCGGFLLGILMVRVPVQFAGWD
jgi:hypothetical protein